MLIDFQFDALAISESKLQTGTQPKVDITINGQHSLLSTLSKAAKGGVLLYIKEHLIFKPRPDLHIYADKTIESHYQLSIQMGKIVLLG